MSNEYVIRTDRGVIRAHSIKRKSDEKVWDGDTLENIRSIPAKSIPHRMGFQMTTRMQNDTNDEIIDDEESEAIVIDHEAPNVTAHTPEVPQNKFRVFSVLRDDILKYTMSSNYRDCKGIE